MKEKVYGLLAKLLLAVMALLSLADAGMFIWTVLRGSSRLYLLFALSLVGAAGMLLCLLFRRRQSPALTLVGMAWLFINAFVFLLLPSQAYLLTVAAAAPVDWLFKVVPYFFAVALTVVSITQTLWHKDT